MCSCHLEVEAKDIRRHPTHPTRHRAVSDNKESSSPKREQCQVKQGLQLVSCVTLSKQPILCKPHGFPL